MSAGAPPLTIEAIGPSDVRLITPIVHADERGGFYRTFCTEALAGFGIDFTPVQGNSSLTRTRHSVRGMHFQRAPKADAKLVRCTAGTIHDVVFDLREHSATRGAKFEIELSASLAQVLYIPAGFAHGFQSLEDDCVVEYLMGAPYCRELYDGVRHDDPDIAVAWPHPVTTISHADRAWADAYPRMPWIRR